jgi:hypothetical protein
LGGRAAQRATELARTNEQLGQGIEERTRAEKRKSLALKITKTILESMSSPIYSYYWETV